MVPHTAFVTLLRLAQGFPIPSSTMGATCFHGER